MRKVFIFCLIFVFAFCGYLFADVLTLKSGQEIEGDILGTTEDSVSIDFMGVELTYFMDEVASINRTPVGGMATPEAAAIPAEMPQGAVAPADYFEGGVPDVISETGSAFDSGDIIERGEELSRSLQSEPPISTPSVSREPSPFISGDTFTQEDFELPPEAAAGAAAAMGVMVVVMFIIGIAAYVYGALCLMFIAKKTNQGPTWMAWVPIANLFLMAKIAGLPYIWLLIFLGGFIPYLGALVSMGFAGYIWWKIAEARGKPGWLGILCVLPLASFVGMGILAFTE